mgnify:CR=1 FL=1
MRRSLLVAALAAVLPGAAGAQGALGLQGYGYPTGQIGSAALALGGANAEIDPASALNPASIGMLSRYSVYMQYEPEFRTTRFGGASDKTTTIRFPAFMLAGGFGRFTAGLSATTLLDRSWTNIVSDSQLVGGEMIPSTLTAASAGALTDARFAASYWVSPKLLVGAGLSALIGQNRVRFGRTFPDSTGVGDVVQSSTINFSGSALSAGVVWIPSDAFVVGLSARSGGALEATQGEVTLGEGNAPSRYGLTLAYTGIPNTTISGRFDHTAWSKMDALGGPQMSTFDANEIGLGLEVLGPRIGGAPSLARIGVRDRTLPFGVNGDKVSERGFSGGVGIPVARGRGQIDLSIQRATRSAGGASEKAWNLSIGLGIRP